MDLNTAAWDKVILHEMRRAGLVKGTLQTNHHQPQRLSNE
jgi:hypothetical protein